VTSTVVVAGAVAAIAIFASASVATVSAVDTAARAQGGADLAALAAARAARGQLALDRPAIVVACSQASATAARNAVSVIGCDIDSNGRATVSVAASLPGGLGGVVRVVRTARAGPSGVRELSG